MKSVFKLRGALVLTVLIGVGLWWLVSQDPAPNHQTPRKTVGEAEAVPTAKSAAPTSDRNGGTALPVARTIPAPRPSVSAEFDLWAEKFIAAATPQSRDALVEEGKSLALARRDQMVELIEQNPEQALNAALPYGIRKQLPDVIKSLIEETVSGRGSFTAVHSKALPGREIGRAHV